MLVSQQALDLLKASASRSLRTRWLVVVAETGQVVATASLCRPVARPGFVIVGIR